MGKLKRISLILTSLVFHFLAGGIIYYFWRSVAQWYWNYRPVLGVDFYNTASYVGYLARHFALRVNGWKYIWHGGYPMQFDYPTLHAYLNLPLLSVFSLPQAVQAYMLLACFLFLFFSYLLFWEISKDRVLAIILTIASSFSIALYGPLVWGGSLPYFATQFFLPLTVWLLVKYFNTNDKRWYFLSSLFLGISLLGHPQVAFSYAMPISFLLLLFYPFEGEKIFSLVRLKRLFLYFLIALIVGYSQLALQLGRTPLQIIAFLPRIINTLLTPFIGGQKALPGPGGVSSADTAAAKGAAEIAQFQKDQLKHFISETNPLFFIFLAASVLVLLLSFVVRKKRRKSFKVLIYALPALWVIFYNSLYAYGISFFHGGWYRVFWPFPLSLGILISFIWGDFWTSMKERFSVFGKKPVLRITWTAISAVIVLSFGAFLLRENPSQKMLKIIEDPRLRQQSSAFPDSLNVYIEREEFGELKGKLTPTWLNPNETNYRLYENDQRVNIWWNALFDMPLVKGYIDDPSGDSSGGFYWTSIALSQSQGRSALIETWGVPEEMAYNNALFLIDWYSIKYLEAEHEKSDTYNPPTSYLAKSDIFLRKEKVGIPGWAELYAWKPGEPGQIVWHKEEEEFLTYYEVKDNLVSPITHTTNATTIGVIGAVDAYRTLLRDLAAVNLNSRKVIPLQLGQFIDDVPYQSLKDMDAVILYAYDYKNHGKVWGELEKYVKEGGKVLIETGSDVKQTDSVNLPGGFPKELPKIFPIAKTKKEEMGLTWQLSGESKETEGINLEAFGPPILDDKPVSLSLPDSTDDLKEGARVILSNKAIPLIVSWEYGEGEVIWSGMNLPYHITTHKNPEEAKFFKNLLGDLITTDEVEYSEYKVERKSASKMIIDGSQAKGVFFREQDFPVWEAKIKSNIKDQPFDLAQGKKLNIYRAGPTYPGFMYVIIPKDMRDREFKVVFSYHGDFWSYFWQILSFLTILVLVDRIFLKSCLVIPILNRIWTPLTGRIGGWWERGEE